MPFNFSSPEYLSRHRTRKNRVSPVSRACPAYMNSPSVVNSLSTPTNHGANAKMFLSASTVSFLLKKLIYFITNVCYLPLHICIKLLEPPKKLSQM